MITDYLPSGLKVISGRSNTYASDPNVTYPNLIDGQKVSFCVSIASKEKPIVYYVRVVSKGSFTAEPSILQHFQSPGRYGVGGGEKVEIK
jgi:hypothetical protein